MDIFNTDFKDFILYLNKFRVEYVLVGGYAVILRGYSRSTGDMDLWINKTHSNYHALRNALHEFGILATAVPEEMFFSEAYDVFSFGKPPYAIELLTSLKGFDTFEEVFKAATLETVDDIEVRVIHLKHLIQAKKAAGRFKDKNDLENLPEV